LDCVLNQKLFANKAKRYKLRDQIGLEVDKNPQLLPSMQNALHMAKNQGLGDKDINFFTKQSQLGENKNARREEKLWRIPPMHDAVMNNNFGHWCVMSILGGMDEALNGMETSCMKLLNR
jgi:hypothetical protein